MFPIFLKISISFLPFTSHLYVNKNFNFQIPFNIYWKQTTLNVPKHADLLYYWSLIKIYQDGIIFRYQCRTKPSNVLGVSPLLWISRVNWTLLPFCLPRSTLCSKSVSERNKTKLLMHWNSVYLILFVDAIRHTDMTKRH